MKVGDRIRQLLIGGLRARIGGLLMAAAGVCGKESGHRHYGLTFHHLAATLPAPTSRLPRDVHAAVAGIADDVAVRCPVDSPKTAVQCRHKMEKLRMMWKISSKIASNTSVIYMGLVGCYKEIVLGRSLLIWGKGLVGKKRWGRRGRQTQLLRW